jgi:hypothetical protein
MSGNHDAGFEITALGFDTMAIALPVNVDHFCRLVHLGARGPSSVKQHQIEMLAPKRSTKLVRNTWKAGFKYGQTRKQSDARNRRPGAPAKLVGDSQLFEQRPVRGGQVLAAHFAAWEFFSFEQGD